MIDKKRGLEICSFSSGSSGNCYLLRSNNTAVLVDAGITGKMLMEGLEKTKTNPDEIRGILISHEHSDHIRGLSVIHNKIKNAPIYASQGTIGALAEKMGTKIYDLKLRPVSLDDKFAIGDIDIRAFELSHDAEEPMGFVFEAEGKGIAVATDTGILTRDAVKKICDSDILVLESNYEERILFMNKKYPYELKQRIMGERGHLSNDACADAIEEILKKRRKGDPPTILLAHLSKENNTPENARITVENLLRAKSVLKGKDYLLEVLRRDEIGKIYKTL